MKHTPPPSQRLLFFLAVCAASVFVGRAYEYWFFGAPLGGLLWDQGLMAAPVEMFLGMSWTEYAADLRVPAFADAAGRGLALVFVACAIGSVTLAFRYRRVPATVLGLGSAILLLHAALETRTHFYHVAQFFEYAIQIAVPLLLVAVSRRPDRAGHYRRFGLAAVAVTFVAHGLYALGVYPVPGHFVDMTIALLGVSESGARTFLAVVGTLDLLLLPLLCFRSTQRYALYYAVAWGLATSVARVASGSYGGLGLAALHGTAYQTVYRLAHGLLPLTLLLWPRREAFSASAKQYLDAGLRAGGSVVQARRVTLGVLAALLLALGSVTVAQAAQARFRLVVTADPATQATVAWDQISGTDPVLRYDVTDHGTDERAYLQTAYVNHVRVSRGMNNHFVRLSGLKPDTEYYFLVADSEGANKRFWFRTAPNVKERLSFIAGGDSRNNRDVRRKANMMVSKLKPHAVLFGGDMTNLDSDQEWIEWMDDWQLTNGPDGRMTPIVPTRGNHEGTTAIFNLFDVPNQDVYYAINWAGGLARVYTLNTEVSVRGDQYNWLEQDLAGHRYATWRIVQYHRAMRPHNNFKADGASMYDAWAPLFHREKIRLVVECDVHLTKTTFPIVPSTGPGSDEGFIRNDTTGTIYTGEGSWGAPLRPADDPKSWTRSSGSINQFKLLFIDEERIEQRIIRVDNADQVGEVSNDDPFTLPDGIDVWQATGGDVVEILPVGQVAEFCAPLGTPCDDGDPLTVRDAADGSCACVGIPPAATLSVRVKAPEDDVEQRASTGGMQLTSSDLELIRESTTSATDQVIGLRFTDINLPPDAVIEAAYLQFTVDEPSSEPTSLTIAGMDPGAATPKFDFSTYGVSKRPTVGGAVEWPDVPAWIMVGDATAAQRSPDLSGLVTVMLNASTWRAPGTLGFRITGTGRRTADAFDDDPDAAPMLVIRYSLPEDNPLPVAFVDVAAEQVGERVRVSWTTAAEQDNASFCVERSVDGESWGSVAEATGAGTTDQLTDYRAYDATPMPGWCYYRVRQVDLDGTSTVSSQTAVYVESGSAAVRVYPTLAVDYVQVAAPTDVASAWIADASGRVLRRISGGEPLPVGDLPAGPYVVYVEERNGRMSAHQIVKQ